MKKRKDSISFNSSKAVILGIVFSNESKYLRTKIVLLRQTDNEQRLISDTMTAKKTHSKIALFFRASKGEPN